MKTRIAVLFFGLACLSAVSAGEQDSEDVTELDRVVVVASKVERPVREVAGIVDIVEHEDIERRMVRDLDELLQMKPGIEVTRDAGRFSNTGISIRGVEGNRVVTEIDGVPIPDGFAIGDFSNAGRDLVDPEIIKRVEILRGPASALYGSDALGGVISITTLDPEDLATGDGAYRALKSGYGSADDSHHLSGYFAAQGSLVDTLAVATRREGEELEALGGEANPANHETNSALLKFVHYSDAAEATRLVLDFEEGSRKTDVLSLVNGPGRYATTTRMEGDDSRRRFRASLSGEAGLDSGLADQFKWNIFHQDTEIEQLTLQELEADARNPDPTRRDRRFWYSQVVNGGEMTFENMLSTRLPQQLVYGVEVTQTQVQELRDATLTNLSTGATTDSLLGETFPVRDFPTTDITELGIYIQDEILLDASNWTLVPALRYEYYELEPEADAVYLADNPVSETVSVTEEKITPRLALIRQLGSSDSLFLQYAKGFRAAPFEDVNIGLDIPAFNIRAIPNPDLEPETSDSFELGWRHDDGEFFAEIAAFHMTLDKLIESRSPLGPDPDTGVLLFQSINRDEARIHGVEIRTTWRAGRSFDVLEGWSFDAAANITRGADTSADTWLNSVNPDTAVLAAHFLSDAKWSLDIYWRLVDSKDRVDESAGTLFKTAGYGLLDAYLGATFGDGIVLRAGVSNITDKQYWQWLDVRGVPEDYALLPLYARPGRNMKLDIKWSF